MSSFSKSALYLLIAVICGFQIPGYHTTSSVHDRMVKAYSEAVDDSHRRLPFVAPGKRRRLSTVLMHALADEEMIACENRQYSLVVRLLNQHFGLTLIPVREENVEILDEKPSKQCSALYLHNDYLGKVIYQLDDWETDLDEFTRVETFELGLFDLSTVMKAFHRAADTSTSTSATAGYGEFDILDNNCATFVLFMLEELDIALTAHHVSWAINGLTDQQGHVGSMVGLVRALRAHPAFALYFPDGAVVTDSLIVMEFVMA